MDNAEYARVLSEISTLRQIRGDNHFKVRAYENGARAIEGLTESLEGLLDASDTLGIEGIGKSIETELRALHQTGVSPAHQALLNELDPGLLEIMKIQGLGPKRIKLMYDELGISNITALEKAAREGHIAELAGLGKKTQEKILSEIERLASSQGRMPLPSALKIAESVRDELARIPGVEKIEIAGSIRRARETIGDVDILIGTTEDPNPIFDAYVALRDVEDVLARGDTKTSARLRNGLQVDVRIVRPDQFGAALHYFTGSKEHNVKLRTRAKKMGLKINEYGVFRVEDESTPIASATEEELFETLGLTYIPPEIREGTHEIEDAEKRALPDLITAQDVRGDIHMHTVETDGRHTIEEMAEAARALGLEYIVITDHSQAVAVANGMDPPRFEAHIARIRKADEHIEGIRVLAGIEVDILKDGSLDMDADLLAECDWVVGSIHSHFNLDEDAMTQRLLRAIDTGLLSCLGHPTGRILGGRGAYRYDLDTVIDHAREKRVAFEINGSPGRLDLNSDLAARVKSHGAKLVLGSDAHSTGGLADLRFAVQQARRAWLTADDVLNSLSAQELAKSRVSPA